MRVQITLVPLTLVCLSNKSTSSLRSWLVSSLADLSCLIRRTQTTQTPLVPLAQLLDKVGPENPDPPDLVVYSISNCPINARSMLDNEQIAEQIAHYFSPGRNASREICDFSDGVSKVRFGPTARPRRRRCSVTSRPAPAWATLGYWHSLYSTTYQSAFHGEGGPGKIFLTTYREPKSKFFFYKLELC